MLVFLKKKYRDLKKWVNYRYYQSFVDDLIEEKKSKKKIKILFFVMSIDMWKSNILFKLFLDDPLFEPYIIPQLLQNNTREQNERIQTNIKEYFDKLGFPFINAIDFKTETVFDVNAFNADIIFCSQPYDSGIKEHQIKSIWKGVLFSYVPYCINQELNPIFYTGLYQNICWKYYCTFQLNKDYESTLLYNKGKNMLVVGHPLFEEIEKNRGSEFSPWKNKEHKKWRLIWAPHHSILSSDVLGYSNFLDLAEPMQQFAEAYQDVVEIAFKPHPILKEKLLFLDNWGLERTENYYNFWRDSSNTILSEGAYADLFMTSDAMIHDSSSFICEYLYTKKPVMFLSKKSNDIRNKLNVLAQNCLDLHYKGYTINDVESFVNTIVIEAKDPLKSERDKFCETFLKKTQYASVGELIYKDIKSSLLR